VLLNNDVVVTDGWLDQLITLANAKPGREENVTGENAENAESRSETEGGIETCGRFGCGVGRPAHSAGAGSHSAGAGSHSAGAGSHSAGAGSHSAASRHPSSRRSGGSHGSQPPHAGRNNAGINQAARGAFAARPGRGPRSEKGELCHLTTLRAFR
jgi:hypothetical protein